MYTFSSTTILPSHPGCHIALSRVPCTVQYVLVAYPFYYYYFKIFYLFIWLFQILVLVFRTFSCGLQTLSCGMLDLIWGMWDLVPWPLSRALGVWSLYHRITREIPIHFKYSSVYMVDPKLPNCPFSLSSLHGNTFLFFPDFVGIGNICDCICGPAYECMN